MGNGGDLSSKVEGGPKLNFDFRFGGIVLATALADGWVYIALYLLTGLVKFMKLILK